MELNRHFYEPDFSSGMPTISPLRQRKLFSIFKEPLRFSAFAFLLNHVEYYNTTF